MPSVTWPLPFSLLHVLPLPWGSQSSRFMDLSVAQTCQINSYTRAFVPAALSASNTSPRGWLVLDINVYLPDLVVLHSTPPHTATPLCPLKAISKV